MSGHRQESQQRSPQESSSQQSPLNTIAQDFAPSLSEVQNIMAPAKRIDSRHLEQTDDEESPELTSKHKSTPRQFLEATEALQLLANPTQQQVINHILKRQDGFAVWGNELLNTIDERHEEYQAQSNNTDIKLNQIMDMLQKKSASSSSQGQFKMPSVGVHRFYSTGFFKSGRSDGNDPLQDAMLRLAKTKEVESVDEGKFRESDIGYFDPRKSESYGGGDYVIVADKVYYRSVWLFIDAAKSIATSKGNRLVRINLHRCLQGDAQTWYIGEIDGLQRFGLKGGHGLENWEECLTKRFKMSESKVMELLAEDKYTIEDVRKQRTVTSYVQSVIRHAKDAGFTTVSNQLNWVWNHLAPGLQRDVSKSNFKTIVLEFIEQLEDLEHAWKRYYAVEALPKKRWDVQSQQNLLPASQGHFSQYQQPNSAYSRGNGYTNNQNFGQAPSQPSQRGYQNNNQGYSRNNQWDRQNRNGQGNYPAYLQVNNQQNQQRMLEASPQQRQASWTKPAFNPAAQPMGQQTVSVHHASQEGEDQREVYHGQEEEEEFEHQQSEHHSAEVGAFFNDSSKPEMGLNPWTCGKCSFAFGNSDELRDHLLDYHGVDSRVSTYNKRLQDERYAKHAKEHVYNYSSQFSFGYAQVEVFIFDYDLTSCLDTGGGVSLCSRSLLFQNKNLYGIVHRTRPITVIGVAGQQICDEYVEQEVLLGLNKFPIKVKAYLVDRLQPGLIIGMDVLGRGDIDLQFSRNMLVIGGVDVPLRYSPMGAQTFYHFVTCNTMKPIQKGPNRKWKFDVEKSMDFAPKMLCISEPCARTETTNAGLEMPNEIGQSGTQDYKQCENAKSEEFSAGYDDLSRPRSAPFFAARSAANSACHTVSHTCRRCKQSFGSGNLLHRHLTHCNRGTKSRVAARDLAAPWRRL